MSILTSTIPLYVNYKNTYRYKRVDKTSIVRVEQAFNEASPPMYQQDDDDGSVWEEPYTEVLPRNGTSTAEEMQNTQLNNIFVNDAEIKSIISGNVEWDNYSKENNISLEVTVSVDSSADITFTLTPDDSAYYVYLPTALSSADSVDVTTNIDNANSTTVEVECHATTVNVYTRFDLANSPKFVSVLHAVDFLVLSSIKSRVLRFPAHLKTGSNSQLTAIVPVGTKQTAKTFAESVGVDTWLTTDAIKTYQITSFAVTDTALGVTSGPANIVANNQYYTVPGLPDASVQNFLTVPIDLTPRYDTSNIIKTIPLSKVITWKEDNTTNKDKSGTFGSTEIKVGQTAATTATFTFDAYVDSSNEKLTQTGVNDNWFVSTYKGSAKKLNCTIKLPIINGVVTVYGQWYLQSGSKNYLHPSYNNWHDGGGKIVFKSLTY